MADADRRRPIFSIRFANQAPRQCRTDPPDPRSIPLSCANEVFKDSLPRDVRIIDAVGRLAEGALLPRCSGRGNPIRAV